MDELLPLTGSAYENTSYTVYSFHEFRTQFSDYFQDNYILHFTPCQPFTVFSLRAKVIFVAMHTLIIPFLCNLSTSKTSAKSCLLTMYEQILISNKIP